MSHSFFGGVHPSEQKAATEHKPIVPLPVAPSQVVIPMSQHVGAPCKPIVSEGDTVKVGQKIGETAGLGAPIHASVSGTVAAVEPWPHPGGDKVLSVVINNDGLDTFASALAPHPDFESLNVDEILDIIGEAGIAGMGGAGFPTKVKIQSAIGKADTIIINAVECEPYITADHRLMLEQGNGIIIGVRIIMQALRLPSATIGVEDNKMDAVKTLERLLHGQGTGIQVLPMRTRYPQGAEKQLIQRVTGRQVPPGGLPADVGCAVFNVSTAFAIYEAVCLGKPLTHRTVTVTGGAITIPGNFYVPIGTPFQCLVDAGGGFKTEPDRILTGGPMMGIAQYDLSVPVIKGCNAVTCMTAEEHAPAVANPICIRCGKCVNVCPMHLSPVFINMYTMAGRYEETAHYRVADCIECGSCSFTCPAGIPLVQNIRTAKAQLRTLAQKAKEKEGK